MYSLNGVRQGAGRGAPVLNGGKYGIINANRPYEYNKWRMVWNGNHFAPPEPGSVLYLPGIPGQGTVIQDFAESYSDSTINTSEILDATEIGVDCSADATTACPANSVILVESEKMFVTATGTTLTVNRGYGGTVATTHATAKDIYVWIPNHGTIFGATWVRLPSGLWVLSFDGDDRVVIGTVLNAYLASNQAFSIIFWVKTTTVSISSLVTNEDIDSPYVGLDIYQRADGRLAVGFVQSATKEISVIMAGVINTGAWFQIGLTYDGSKTAAGMLLYKNGSPGSLTILADTVDATFTSTTDLQIGARDGNNQPLTGQMGLELIPTVVLSASQIANHYEQEKSLFGV